MNTLHLINKPGSPFTLCQSSVSENDGVLFIEDGVYCLTESPDDIQELTQKQSVYCLEADSQARGMLTMPQNVTAINYDVFVQLCCRYDRVISWF